MLTRREDTYPIYDIAIFYENKQLPFTCYEYSKRTLYLAYHCKY